MSTEGCNILLSGEDIATKRSLVSEANDAETPDVNDPIHYGHGPGWVYSNFTCMECGEECGTNEEVDTGFGGPFEMWCYCRKCDVETFHPRERI